MLRQSDSTLVLHLEAVARPRWRSALRSRWFALVFVGSVYTACSSGTQRPPGAPPSPASITREQPGGDARDPHRAALQRLLEQDWGRRADKDEQLLVPLPDVRHWKRVRFWLIDHFTGFRYGSDYHGLSVVVIRDLPDGKGGDSAQCMREAEAWARPQLSAFGVRMGSIARTRVPWNEAEVVVHGADAVVDYGLGPAEFSAVWAAYPAYDDACLIYALAVPWRDQHELAEQVLERWTRHAVPNLQPLTHSRPYRQ